MTQELLSEWNKMQVMIEKNANLFNLNTEKLNKLVAYCIQNKNRFMYDIIGKNKDKIRGKSNKPLPYIWRKWFQPKKNLRRKLTMNQLTWGDVGEKNELRNWKPKLKFAYDGHEIHKRSKKKLNTLTEHFKYFTFYMNDNSHKTGYFRIPSPT